MKNILRPSEEIAEAVILRVVREEGVSKEIVSRWFEELLKFLDLGAAMDKGDAPAHDMVPSRAVDLVWHSYILHTAAYFDYCENLCGSYIHHHPTMPGGDPGQAQGIEGYEATYQTMVKRFGEIDPIAWPSPVKMNTHEEFLEKGYCVIDASYLGVSPELRSFLEGFSDSSFLNEKKILDRAGTFAGDTAVLTLMRKVTGELVVPANIKILEQENFAGHAISQAGTGVFLYSFPKSELNATISASSCQDRVLLSNHMVLVAKDEVDVAFDVNEGEVGLPVVSIAYESLFSSQ